MTNSLTIKISFINGLTIFFHSKLRYLNSLAFVSLSIKVSNILTCSRDFLDFLQLYLIFNTKGTKGTNLDTMLACSSYFLDSLQSSLSDDKSVKNIDRGIWIKATSIGTTCIKNTYT